MNNTDNEKTCRICLDTNNPEKMIKPCSCDGTSKWVHEDCLKKWIQTCNNPEAKLRCMECKTMYLKKDNNTKFLNLCHTFLDKYYILYYFCQQFVIFLLNFISSQILFNDYSYFLQISKYEDFYRNYTLSLFFYLGIELLWIVIYTYNHKFKRLIYPLICTGKNICNLFYFGFVILWISLFIPLLSIILYNTYTFVIIVCYIKTLKIIEDSHTEIIDLENNQ